MALSISLTQIAGVHVVDFQMKKVEVEHNPFELIGLARGGQKLKAVRESFTKLLEVGSPMMRCITLMRIIIIVITMMSALRLCDFGPEN